MCTNTDHTGVLFCDWLHDQIPHFFLEYPGIEGGFDVEQEQYEDDVKVVILPDRQEVTQEDLATMPDVVRERVRH